MPRKKREVPDIKFNRGDDKYLRIEQYSKHEIRLAVLYEALIRLGKAFEPEKYFDFNIQYDTEYHIDSVINRVNAIQRNCLKNRNNNSKKAKDQQSINIERILTLCSLANVKIKENKQYFINAINVFAEKLENEHSIDQLKFKTFGMFQNDMHNLLDTIKQVFGIYGADCVNFVLRLFQDELSIFRQELSHSGISNLQKYNKRILLEIDLLEPLNLQLEYLNQYIEVLHKNFQNKTLDHFLHDIDDNIFLHESAKMKKETSNGKYFIDISKGQKEFQRKIADMFFIYDSLQAGALDKEIVGSANSTQINGTLSTYYQNIIYKDMSLDYLNISRDAYNSYKEKINNFMKIIKKDYHNFVLK